jgi:hypothetical protein
LLFLAVLTALFLYGNTDDAGQTKAQEKRRVHVVAHQCNSAKKAIVYYSRRIDSWRGKMGEPVTQIADHATRHASKCPRYLAHVLQHKAYAMRKAYEKWHRLYFHRLYEKYRCIHEHEGAWNANTGNGYWGGLQMDWGFMHTYGPEFIQRWGLAHRWPVWAQLIAAERAFNGFAGYGGRGYSPWGTRGMCGV